MPEPHGPLRFAIPSSDGRRQYTVTFQPERGWACACPAWTHHMPRQDCKHIRAAQNLEPHEDTTSAALDAWRRLVRIANVGRVTPHYAPDGHLTQIDIPLQPLGDAHTDFLATMAYDLDQLGVPWPVVQESAIIAKDNTRAAIRAHVADVGRVIFDRFVRGQGWVGTRRLPLHAHRPSRF